MTDVLNIFITTKKKFENELERKNYIKALNTINKYKLLKESHILRNSFFRNNSEVESLLKKIQEYYPKAFALTTIFSCKHGLILYQTSIRFEGISKEKEEELIEKLRELLPEKIEEEKRRSIESMFMDVEYL